MHKIMRQNPCTLIHSILMVTDRTGGRPYYSVSHFRRPYTVHLSEQITPNWTTTGHVHRGTSAMATPQNETKNVVNEFSKCILIQTLGSQWIKFTNLKQWGVCASNAFISIGNFKGLNSSNMEDVKKTDALCLLLIFPHYLDPVRKENKQGGKLRWIMSLNGHLA